MKTWFVMGMLLVAVAALPAEEAALLPLWNVVSQNTFMTFFSIATLVDAHQAGTYDDATALSIINQYLTLNIACVECYAALSMDENLPEADRTTYNKLRVVHMMMNEELTAYGRYIPQKDTDELHLYEARHDEAWKIIHDIFASLFTEP